MTNSEIVNAMSHLFMNGYHAIKDDNVFHIRSPDDRFIVILSSSEDNKFSITEDGEKYSLAPSELHKLPSYGDLSKLVVRRLSCIEKKH